MKTSTLIKKAWMSGWDNANNQYTEWMRDMSWESSSVYSHYLKALREEKAAAKNNKEKYL